MQIQKDIAVELQNTKVDRDDLTFQILFKIKT
jgi:hypothetical protein